MKKLVLLAIAVTALLCALIFSAPQAENLSGTWIGKTVVPSGETDEVTVILDKAPDGYKGKISDSLGLVTEAEIYNYAFNEGKIAFEFAINDGTEIMIELTLTEGKLVGTWSDPSGSSGSLELSKQKSPPSPDGAGRPVRNMTIAPLREANRSEDHRRQINEAQDGDDGCDRRGHPRF